MSRIIAIDGPAGSGKSTVARTVAARLGLDYLDTGAMYRSVAFEALRVGVDPGDSARVAALARDIDLTVADRVVVNGIDATDAIRGLEVTRAVSAVAANAEVRREMVRRQREWAGARKGGVVEGRDIGSVVFPEARLKVFLTADPAERQRRRRNEADGAHRDALAADIARRDASDASRDASPMVIADGAVEIDTTGRTIDDVVTEVLAHLGDLERDRA